MHEHLDAGNDLHTPCLGQTDQLRLDGIVHHVEKVFRVQLILVQWRLPRIPHPDWGGVNDDVEGELLKGSPLDAAGMRLAGELLSGSG